jgi:hypothetical protein
MVGAMRQCSPAWFGGTKQEAVRAL